MKKYKWLIILFNLILLLGYFNYSVIKKEDLLKNGQLILLELAPVDPRSLMQGDYMSLRYAIVNTIGTEGILKRGYCVVTLDKNGVAHRGRFQENKTPLKAGEYLINYTSDDWNVNIGAESFFFQEGHAKKYETAAYGGIKIDGNGNSLLIGLYDKNLKKIN
ncbi:GDYXXLXY domain-containing protein [Chryseobacterium vaccae]|uniref:GDYXXLXY domain-containing protein n=1 Tax=Chryseobacterium vaccae TaxID=2604424 RepID=UPI00129560CA|nr:GDYXXLXY domain-containing protein [Chryseobacterium vaccae]